jgi:hypothetical protein
MNSVFIPMEGRHSNKKKQKHPISSNNPSLEKRERAMQKGCVLDLNRGFMRYPSFFAGPYPLHFLSTHATATLVSVQPCLHDYRHADYNKLIREWQ